MLIKISLVHDNAPDSLRQLPFQAMVQQDGHTLNWWKDFKRQPSIWYDRHKTPRHLYLDNDPITVIHHYEKKGRTPEHSILRHYRRNNPSILVDARVEGAIGIPSLLPLIWMNPRGIRAEIECGERNVLTLFLAEEGYAADLPEIKPDFGYMALDKETRKATEAIFRNAISQTASIVKAIQGTHEKYFLRRKNQLEECQEMLPILRRTPLGILLGRLGVETKPTLD